MTDSPKLSRQQRRWLVRKDVKAYVKACPDVLDPPWAKQMEALSRYTDAVHQHDILNAALRAKFGDDVFDKRLGDVCNVTSTTGETPRPHYPEVKFTPLDPEPESPGINVHFAERYHV